MKKGEKGQFEEEHLYPKDSGRVEDFPPSKGKDTGAPLINWMGLPK